jgi:polysaccharide export outer membrane protein
MASTKLYATFARRKGCVFLSHLCALFLLAVLPVHGQDAGKASGAITAANNGTNDYAVGLDDILSIVVADSPEIGGKFRVTDTGKLELPALQTPIQVQGMTPLQVSQQIATALRNAELLRDPIVNVFVEEYHSRTVTVLGAVNKPSVYSLQRPTTVLEVLSLAGGLLPTAGTNLTVARKNSIPTTSNTSENTAANQNGNTTLNIDLAKLMFGKDPSLNVEVQPGDVISVSTAPVIYVVGAVTKPGGFQLQDPSSGMTVLQSLAMAQGLTSVAASDRSIIIRRSASRQERQEIPINVAKLMSGNVGDQLLEPNDIVFVPESSTKKSLHKMSEIAVQALNGIAVYGVGYRVGGLH